MRAVDEWKPSKFVLKNGHLLPSDDPKELGIGSRVVAECMAAQYQLALQKYARGKLLDLGCGSGALIRALRSRGVEAYGIELKRPEIVASLRDDVKPWITLYAGGFPLPFADRRFRSVICSEVLEHIPDYAGAIREIARVAPEALITVPDMSAIPTLFPHGVVPWHLLEATHLNFFTQASLGAALGSVFRSVSFSRLGEFEVNGTRAFMNLVARCAA